MNRSPKKTKRPSSILLLLLGGLIVLALGGGKQSTPATSVEVNLTSQAQNVVALETIVNPEETDRATYRYKVETMRRGEENSTATPTPMPTLRPRKATDAPEKPEVYVWIPKSGKKYHSKSSCSNMSKPAMVTLEEAKSMGYDPCKKCKPPK